ncbi:protein FAR1-RELATED SEQUENCE 5-like [Cornus florida]|uniref:protein FAR1-RELATED SEQUENCE 5-like n=1 Tax=Cornus florida TaxID=4283 RepID=UPI00289CEFA1|nr:protein FAR1-RELATED SEQUENCE 5-like [Cornus florida]
MEENSYVQDAKMPYDHEISSNDKGTEQELDEVETSKAGMIFQSEEEVHSYYNNYAKCQGFGIAKSSVKNRSDSKSRYFSLACSRNGKLISTAKNSFNPRPSTKANCKAKINVTVKENGNFIITHVYLDHNHALSLTKARHFRCNKALDSDVKRRLELNDLAGIKLNKKFHALVVEAGNYENLSFSERDCRNYIAKARQLRLGIGDAEALRKYFYCMQNQNSNFYYMTDIDDEGRLRNVFWADARCRAVYQSFGDVIAFNSTYLTNRYNMQFAPFVGVNHHGQSVLLGCGLLSNEDTDTYTWLFETWLAYRHRWVPVFLKCTFWARMSTTQRSESMNAFFDEYVHSKTTLKQFVKQYDNALKSKIEKESIADFVTFSTTIPTITRFAIERHVVSVMIKDKVNEVPSHYILKRWQNDIKCGYTFVKNTYDDFSNNEQRHRNNKLIPQFHELKELGTESDDKCELLITLLNETKEKFIATDSNCDSKQINQHLLGANNKLLTPLKARTKGCPLSKRKESLVEKIASKGKKVQNIPLIMNDGVVHISGPIGLNIVDRVAIQENRVNTSTHLWNAMHAGMTANKTLEVYPPYYIPMSNPSWQNLAFYHLQQRIWIGNLRKRGAMVVVEKKGGDSGGGEIAGSIFGNSRSGPFLSGWLWGSSLTQTNQLQNKPTSCFFPGE